MPRAEDDTAATADGSPRLLCFIVEDEPAIRRFLTLAAVGSGVEAEAFEDAKDALASPRTPDIIFLDLALGGSDAIEMLRELASRGFRGRIQLMSGAYRALLDNVRQVGERLGFEMLPVLAKPFRIAALKDIFALLQQPAREALPVAGERPPAAQLRVDLADALRRGIVEFWYQPKIDLATGAVAGFEALVRIDHPEHGVIGPAAFIPGANAFDLRGLAEHALLAALATSRELAALGFFQPIAINVPISALFTLDIAGIVRDHRPAVGRPPQIVLEITEDQFTSDLATIVEIATRLRLYDVTMSVDDFGHAYSSLARLKALPVSELKIDRSFVAGCASDRDNGVLCQAIIDLAHRFECTVCAEGIETDTDLRALRQMGCELGQGFLFDATMPKAKVIERMRNQFMPKALDSNSAA